MKNYLSLWKENHHWIKPLEGVKYLYFHFWTSSSSIRKKLYSQKDPISGFILTGNFEEWTGVFVLKGCHNKVQQNGWFKIEINYLKEFWSLEVWNKSFSMAMLPLRLPSRILPCLFLASGVSFQCRGPWFTAVYLPSCFHLHLAIFPCIFKSFYDTDRIRLKAHSTPLWPHHTNYLCYKPISI